VDGRDITAASVLSDVLRALGLQEATDRLTTPDDDLLAAYRKRTEAAREEMHRFGANGVPTLITGAGDDRRLVPGNALFGSLEVLIARLKGMSPDLTGTDRQRA
jgi:putative protein-disulfide isomerase